MGYRHLIQEEFNEYLGTKTKYVDIDGVRFYDETIEDIINATYDVAHHKGWLEAGH